MYRKSNDDMNAAPAAGTPPPPESDAPFFEPDAGEPVSFADECAAAEAFASTPDAAATATPSASVPETPAGTPDAPAALGAPRVKKSAPPPPRKQKTDTRPRNGKTDTTATDAPAAAESFLLLGKCSVLDRAASNRITIEEADLSEFFAAVKGGKWRAQIEAIRAEADAEKRRQLKLRTLPQYTICGTFKGTRTKDAQKTCSGFICLDFDLKDNPQLRDARERLRAKERLSRLEFVACVFESPSRGLKAIARIIPPYGEQLRDGAILPQMKLLGLRLDAQGWEHSIASCDAAAYVSPRPLAEIPPLRAEIEEYEPRTIGALFDDVCRRMFFTGKDGYILDDKGTFKELSQGNALARFTIGLNLCNKAARKALFDIQEQNFVAECFESLACFPRGLCELNGEKILVKHGARFIEPARGKATDISAILELLKIVFADDWEQLTFFLSWLKTAREAFEAAYTKGGNGKKPVPYLGILGERSAGKNLLMETIIFPVLGVRGNAESTLPASLTPVQYEKEKQWLGDETISAPCAYLGDDAKTLSTKQREAFTRAIKGMLLESFTANRKHKKGITFNAQQFFIQLGNSETDGNCADCFPLLSGDFKDKAIILHLDNSAAVKERYKATDKTATAARILAQTPAFLDYLATEFFIPENIADKRFGVCGYVAPDAARALEEVSPENELFYELCAKLTEAPAEYANGKRFEAGTIFERISSRTQQRIGGNKQMGQALAKLAVKYPEMITQHGRGGHNQYSFNPHAVDKLDASSEPVRLYNFRAPPFFEE